MSDISSYLNDFDSIKLNLIRSVDRYIEKLIGYNKKYNIKNLLYDDISFDEINSQLNKYFCENVEENNKISQLSFTRGYIIFNFSSIGSTLRNKEDYNLNINVELIKDSDGFLCSIDGKLKFKDCLDQLNIILLHRSFLFKC